MSDTSDAEAPLLGASPALDPPQPAERELEACTSTSLCKEQLQIRERALQNTFSHLDSIAAATQQHAGVESLDYVPIQNEVLSAYTASLSEASAATWQPQLLKLAVTAMIGATLGLLAVAMASLTRALLDHKNARVHAIIHDPGLSAPLLAAWAFHAAWSCSFVALGSLLVEYCRPAAAGAGVSLVIAYLNGNAIPGLLTTATLAVKFVGTVCSATASLALGPEAPMVHLGACVAHVTAHFACVALEGPERWHKSKYCSICWPLVAPARLRRSAQARWGRWVGTELAGLGGRALDDALYSDAGRRELISAGVAAGLAAAFGAPIGGVLFSMEEASTNWSKKISWRSFLAATVAVYTMSQLYPRSQNGLLSFEGVSALENRQWLLQLPFIVAVSIGGGLLGAVFNLLHKWLMPYRAKRPARAARVAEVVGWSLLTISSMFLLAYTCGTCVNVPEWDIKSYGFNFNCADGYYNDLATAYLSVPDQTIQRIYSLGSQPDPQGGNAIAEPCGTEPGQRPCYFTIRSLVVLCASYTVYMALLGGLSVPGGLFMPSIMVGAAFGSVCGLYFQRWLPASFNVQPGVYAIIASTAVLGGVFRSSISLVVIVMEGTQSTKFMLGVILAVVASNWVAQLVHKDGVYETDLEADGSVCFLPADAPPPLQATTAEEIMAKDVKCLWPIHPLDGIADLLRSTSHNGFPVAAPSTGSSHSSPADMWVADGNLATDGVAKGGRLVGLVLRVQLLVLLETSTFCDASGRPLGCWQEAEQQLAMQRALDRRMRTFFRAKYSHKRHLAVAPEVVDAVLGSSATLMQRQTSAPMPNGSTAAGAALTEAGQANGVCHDPEAPEQQEFGDRRANGAWHDPEAAAPQQLYVDLRPFMNRCPATASPNAPGALLQTQFVVLGLRHLVVLDDFHEVVGIITRKDLDHAAGHGAWRRNRMAPTPTPQDDRKLARRWTTGLLSPRHPFAQQQ